MSAHTTDAGRLDVPAGLSGVVVADTTVGDLQPERGYYTYRNHSALELARRSSFEAAWHLLSVGHLPTESELDAFRSAVRPLRRVPPGLMESAGAAGVTPRDALLQLASGLAGVSVVDGIPALYDHPDRRLRDALRLCSVAPTLVASAERARLGQAPVLPSTELDHAANYLFMLRGAEPTEREAAALTNYLVSTMDHGFNASTFATRVVASTGASITAALMAGLGALSGPLHGGAPSRVLDALDEIGTEARIPSWVESRLSAGERIMGFGHAVYRGPDPRADLLREVAVAMGGDRVALAVAFEQEVVHQLERAKPGRRLAANVELYAAVVMEQCGIPRHLFTATFAIARMVGWAAHALEQAEQRKIIRPSARYVGGAMVPLPES
ncbi:citrate/2-methylcitrate synthase [Naasia aerilata]|uniref:Citrate synthase n=1 Tax=Naasia aerilata TaxID=1162966 RepID=A0ABM8GGH3_9MICO|nr:citrate/2-methylcitrate synthase [Naasia aerilata]BDZ47457.1 citrate synthase [Naasia aerilata]